MGLDMYLTGKRFLWTGLDENDTSISKKISELLGIEQEVKQVEISLGYWRKANAIHNWFVENVQEGEDNCKDHYVSEENLIELHKLTNKVLADHSLAEELLPTTSGDFFGDTEYDEWYFKDLEHTKEIIEGVFELSKSERLKKKYIDVYYCSSW